MNFSIFLFLRFSFGRLVVVVDLLPLRLLVLQVRVLHLVVLLLLQLGLQFHTVVKFIVSCVWGVPFRVDIVFFLTCCSPSTANGDNTKCLTVGGGAAADGTVVNMYEEFLSQYSFLCFHSTYPRIPFTFFFFFPSLLPPAPNVSLERQPMGSTSFNVGM
jgi:hypothetical protein